MKKLARSGALALLLTGAAMAVAVGAQAAETINFTYDARGRLVAVNRSGTINNNVTTTYTIDKAENRTSKITTGSP